jgi:hypothetical protein
MKRPDFIVQGAYNKTFWFWRCFKNKQFFSGIKMSLHATGVQIKNSVARVLERTIPIERDRRLSAKLVPTFVGRRCRVVSATDPHIRILGFLDLSRYFFFQVAP